MKGLKLKGHELRFLLTRLSQAGIIKITQDELMDAERYCNEIGITEQKGSK